MDPRRCKRTRQRPRYQYRRREQQKQATPRRRKPPRIYRNTLDGGNDPPRLALPCWTTISELTSRRAVCYQRSGRGRPGARRSGPRPRRWRKALGGGGGGRWRAARAGAQEPEVAKEAPRRRAGIAHAEEAAVTLSAEDLEQPPPGRAHAHARPRQLADSPAPLPSRCEPAGSRGVSVCRSDRVPFPPP